MQRNNIIKIVEFLNSKRGYLKKGKKYLANLLAVTVDEVKIARKLIKKEGCEKVLEGFKSKNHNDLILAGRATGNLAFKYNTWVGTSEEECKEINGVKFNYKKEPIYTTTINTLFISDLHLPMEHHKALEFCIKLRDKYNIQEVVFVGNMLDFYGLSTYEKSVKYDGITNEVELAKLILVDWYEAFPNATVLYGNHIQRLMKKLNLAGIPEEWMKPLEELLEVPNWKFVHSYETDNYVVVHGTGGVNMQKTILARGKSVIQGHHHSKTKLEYYTDKLWGMQLGALVDIKSYAFNYTKEQAIPVIPSCGVLFNGTPIIETLK